MNAVLLDQPFQLNISARREIRRARKVSREEAFLNRMFESIEEGDVIYDVGANIGIISLLLASRSSGTSAAVYSFEPEPRNFRQLQKNIALNRAGVMISAHQIALGREKGVVGLFIRGDAGEGRHSIVAAKGSTGSVQVELDTCAAFAESCGHPPDLMKIDVEGAEGQVLAGMETLLNAGRGPREIFMEVHQKGDADKMPDGETLIGDWLISHGYEMTWSQDRGACQHRQYRLAQKPI